MTLNKKQSKITFNKLTFIICFAINPNFLTNYPSFAQDNYKINELEINRTINLEDDDNINFSPNPFEIVDMIKRSNSMNNATNPSDAIDEALKSFDMIKEDKQI